MWQPIATLPQAELHSTGRDPRVSLFDPTLISFLLRFQQIPLLMAARNKGYCTVRSCVSQQATISISFPNVQVPQALQTVAKKSREQIIGVLQIKQGLG